ncbi:MAG: heavy-metal-associated domain-containing protein [Rhizobacter sp.]|nr:heavy-metal-associated domain-containing protein [Burkholderiales bacterium]
MRTEILKVTGMTCGGCVSIIENALRTVPGVSSVAVSLANQEAIVQFSEAQTSQEQLQSAIEKAGYGVAKSGLAAPVSAKGGCCA